MDNLGNVKELKIFVNSGGGSVFAGQAIYNILKRFNAKKSVFIDGLAASIATVICMAGDTIHMPKNSLFMIHDPSSFAWGSIEEVERVLNALKKVKETIVNVYMEKTNLSKKVIENYMKNETWFTADEAKTKGFIDLVDDDLLIEAKLKNESEFFVNGVKMDFSNYKNKPNFEIADKKTIKVVSEIDMYSANVKRKKHKYKGVVK